MENPEIIHYYNSNTILVKWKIESMLHPNNSIEPWEYNRLLDHSRIIEITKYIKRQNIMDWLLYMVYDTGLKKYKIVDGNHRFHALQAVMEENGDSIVDFSQQYIFVSIRVDPTLGECMDWFQNINKCNPVPNLYLEDNRNQEKRKVLETTLSVLQDKYKKHFSPSAKPNIPNVNRDRLMDLLDILYEKYCKHNKFGSNHSSNFLLEKINAANRQIRENIPKKISAKILEKCNETDCYLFLHKFEWLEENI